MLVMHADLQFGQQIGKGACSIVKIAHHKKTGENYAVKMFNIYDEVRTIAALLILILIPRNLQESALPVKSTNACLYFTESVSAAAS